MKAHAMAAAAVVLLCAAASVASAQQCGFTDTATGATFDLSSLRRPGDEQPYEADDIDGRNFTYYWNICGFTNPPLSGGACTGKAPAWQTWEDNNDCWRLGDTPSDPGDVEWKLLDEDDPTGGVSLTYKNGELCDGTLMRSLTINLLCKDEEDVPDRVVVEQDCHYTVEYPTLMACPLQCPLGVTNRQLCSGHGRCEFDALAGHPRCLCNEGYFTADCSSQGSTRSRQSCDGTCGAMIFLMIVLLIFIALVAMAWYNTVKKHNGYIGGGTNLGAGLVERDSQAYAHGGSASPNAGGPRDYGNDGEVELNLDD